MLVWVSFANANCNMVAAVLRPNHVYHRTYVHKYNIADNATGDNNQYYCKRGEPRTNSIPYSRNPPSHSSRLKREGRRKLENLQASMGQLRNHNEHTPTAWDLSTSSFSPLHWTWSPENLQWNAIWQPPRKGEAGKHHKKIRRIHDWRNQRNVRTLLVQQLESIARRNLRCIRGSVAYTFADM